MGTLGELSHLVEKIRDNGKLDQEQKRVLGQYDKHFHQLEKELEKFGEDEKQKEAFEPDDYKRLYDILQNNSDQELEEFDLLYESFEKGETCTNLTSAELYEWGSELSGCYG